MCIEKIAPKEPKGQSLITFPKWSQSWHPVQPSDINPEETRKDHKT